MFWSEPNYTDRYHHARGDYDIAVKGWTQHQQLGWAREIQCKYGRIQSASTKGARIKCGFPCCVMCDREVQHEESAGQHQSPMRGDTAVPSYKVSDTQSLSFSGYIMTFIHSMSKTDFSYSNIILV